MNINKSNLLPLLAFMVQPFLFSANMLTARFVIGEFPPTALAFWRWLIAFLIILPWVAVKLWRARAIIRLEYPKYLILGGLGMGICGALVYIGANTTTAVNIAVIYSASPVFVLIFAALIYQQKLGFSQYIGVGLALIGVLFVITKASLSALLAIEFVKGDILILIAALSWALYTLWTQHWKIGVEKELQFPLVMLGGIIILFPFMIGEGFTQGWPSLSLYSVAVVLFLSIIASLAAYMVYNYLIANLGGGVASLTLYLSPITTAILGWALLGEEIYSYHLIGLILVIVGISLTQAKFGKNRGKAI